MESTIEYVCNNFGHNVIINGKESVTLEEIRDLLDKLPFPFSWKEIYVDPAGNINASNNEYNNGTTEYPLRNSIANFFSNWRLIKINADYGNTKEGRALEAIFYLPDPRLWDFVNFLQGKQINGKWTISDQSYELPTENYGGRKNLKNTKKTRKTKKSKKSKKSRKTRKIKKRN